ncbi:ZnF_C2H2 [Nesidiocoris tenuis]|uniref:ZnF_C2H2 n=1 Tax=Nesidiocoris tenuis TaxID=355587 RepID=A0ABN7BA53_9HEMI|nr:ZnF_C2H2 [Nesidiocoris tenuis]
MAAPSMVTRSGNNLIVRSVVSGDALFGTEVPAKDPDEFDYYDLSEGEESVEAADGEAEGEELPQCKVKRNYSCVECDYYTQNPRFYLYHQKQVHEHNIRIYECDHCLYASKHSQKLQRHVHMVHLSSGKRKSSEKAKAKTKQNKMENFETDEALVEDENEEEETIMRDETGAQIFKCSACDMTSKNRSMVARHERMVHLKKKFYRCSKCNYVTHMKARYTKHVKYHSMPMIKCDMCDFRTPYKWNLDRHNKNHTGDGPFKCSACNFTAEIKQSLTVHEMNHHVPPVGHLVVSGSNARRRLKVGASDTMGLVTEEDQIDQGELELLRLEREGAAYEQVSSSL